MFLDKRHNVIQDKLRNYEKEYSLVLNYLDLLESKKLKEVAQIEANCESVLIQKMLQFRLRMNQLLEDLETRRWFDSSIAKFNGLLALNFEDEVNLYDKLVSELAKHLNINQCALFLISGDCEADDYSIEMKSCFAYYKKRFEQNSLKRGESLIGQAILDKDIIYLKEVPNFYTKITSGLGEATPSCILISPLFDDYSITGAIELASFKEFNTNEIEFIKSISRVISSKISSLKRIKELEHLNNQTILSHVEMREKEEEIRQQMEEHEANSEELEKKSIQLDEYKKALENDKNLEIIKIREQEKNLLESKLEAQKTSYELIINKLKEKLIKIQNDKRSN